MTTPIDPRSEPLGLGSEPHRCDRPDVRKWWQRHEEPDEAPWTCPVCAAEWYAGWDACRECGRSGDHPVWRPSRGSKPAAMPPGDDPRAGHLMEEEHDRPWWWRLLR